MPGWPQGWFRRQHLLGVGEAIALLVLARALAAAPLLGLHIRHRQHACLLGRALLLPLLYLLPHVLLQEEAESGQHAPGASAEGTQQIRCSGAQSSHSNL